MTAALSSRLLEAIAERERRINAWGHWQVGDSFYHCCAALRTAEDAGDLDYGECDCGLQARRDDALGFCQAHREIVADCQQAIEAGEVKPGSTWNDDAAGAELAVNVLAYLARAYRIEEQ